MSTTPTELAGLLRGCIKWRDGRAWVDNEALLVVADWCDDNGRAEEAAEVREALAVEPSYFADAGGPERFGDSFPGGVAYEVETPSGFARVEDGRDEVMYRASVVGASRSQFETAIRRIHHLARWHCIAHMLGWPPLRLVGDE
jgi:hypothetical protein